MMAPKKKLTKEENLNKRIDKILAILNVLETGCIFWRSTKPHSHIMGIRPVKRTIFEIIGKDTFNPLERKFEEMLFKLFSVYISDKEEDNILTKEEIENKKELEKNGVIYLKSNDLFFIFDFIRNSK